MRLIANASLIVREKWKCEAACTPIMLNTCSLAGNRWEILQGEILVELIFFNIPFAMATIFMYSNANFLSLRCTFTNVHCNACIHRTKGQAQAFNNNSISDIVITSFMLQWRNSGSKSQVHASANRQALLFRSDQPPPSHQTSLCSFSKKAKAQSQTNWNCLYNGFREW